jgi:hypothetical protein
MGNERGSLGTGSQTGNPMKRSRDYMGSNSGTEEWRDFVSLFLKEGGKIPRGGGYND